MLPPALRLGVALLLLPACFNPTGVLSTGEAGEADPGPVSETDATTTTAATATGTTTPPTTLPSQTDPTTEPVTTTEPSTTTEPPPPSCGNGFEEDDEECDDGNADNSDACLDTCKNAYCGDGLIYGAMETCDDGPSNGDDAPCTSSCQKALCGDSLVCPECGEECDFTQGCGRDCKYSARYVFVTSAPYSAGELQGLAGADAICMQHATGVGALAGREFIAWLSVAGAGAGDRLSSSFPFLRMDGQKIANDFADLTDASIDFPINIDENGLTVDATYKVWTGTKADGTFGEGDILCKDWMVPIGMGWVGNPTLTGYEWTDNGLVSCNSEARLYCFQTGS
ncbi:hypothetical protein OV090_17570 [Nannocystis sp. RBIL2]|uniref:hypothetical protein n=1 Tax=Nannocystis sp. RBIL2 TaxID=2996788 RepID=UPI00226DC4AD|nr:hypothetical protein [Nannocystis sp. RBIL2]